MKIWCTVLAISAAVGLAIDTTIIAQLRKRFLPWIVQAFNDFLMLEIVNAEKILHAFSHS